MGAGGGSQSRLNGTDLRAWSHVQGISIQPLGERVYKRPTALDAVNIPPSAFASPPSAGQMP